MILKLRSDLGKRERAELWGFEPQTSCMPYLARSRDSVANLARIDLQDRPKWRTAGGRCGQDCGQGSIEGSPPAGLPDRLFAQCKHVVA
jgi:hypothetical protein